MRPEEPWPQDSGLHFQISRYEWIEPVSKLRYWFRINPWFGQTKETLWFTLRIPFKWWPFLSWKLNKGRWKGYLGWKVYGLGHPEYSTWLPEDYQPPKLVDNMHVAFACVLSFRLDADS
jgi:hypothetical protein